MKRRIAIGALLGFLTAISAPAMIAHAAPTLTPSLGGYVAAGETAPFSFALGDVAWTEVLVTVTLPAGTMSVDDTALALTLQPGFTTFTDVTEISFNGPLADVTTALAERLTWTAPVAPEQSFLQLSITVTAYLDGLTYSAGNGHYYLASTDSLTWSQARDAAAAMTYNGLTGYLATITSTEENAFVADRSGGSNIWFGATSEVTYVNPVLPPEATPYADNDDIRGDWYWGTGPEAGTLFSEGLGAPVTVAGQYASWAPGEPNDSGSPLERCAVTNWSGDSGLWNDLDCETWTLQYIVEFGGIGLETSALQFSNLDAAGPVVDAPGTTPAAVLPPTGVSVLLVASVAALLLLGGVSLALTRRSRPQHD